MKAEEALYRPPLQDIAFVIEQWLEAPTDWQKMPAFEGLDAEAARMVVEAAGDFCADVLAPLNASGDLQGCRFEDGRVRTPDGFPEAYRQYAEGGWTALACDPGHGGQGLPMLLDAALNEMTVATNHGWTMYVGILHGACSCLQAHAPAWMREAWLPHLISGRWLATMCLTEPQAGSDLGLLLSRAEPAGDGSYRIQGSKIFVSGGEQDLSENILHLVLARLPDAPSGSRGISLFAVPKLLPSEGDSLIPNRVFCDGIEKKMGIKGSATCTMRFDEAQGWLIGEPHRGLAAMFIMMNAARVHVGLQGLGHAEMSRQLASDYARERRQMRAVQHQLSAAGERGADPIIWHPPISRIVMELGVWTEGMRALAYWAAHLLDLADHSPDPVQQGQGRVLAALLTPIIKSFLTERGFVLASDALQVFGGYGYVHEYRIEQVLRDSRVAMIYEGTNQIQALDLLQRKVLGKDGDGLEQLLSVFREEVRLAVAHEACSGHARTLQDWCDKLSALTSMLEENSVTDPILPARAAEDYLRLLGLICLAFAWCRAARVATSAFEHKRESACYFFEHSLLEARYRLARVEAACHAWTLPEPAMHAP